MIHQPWLFYSVMMHVPAQSAVTESDMQSFSRIQAGTSSLHISTFYWCDWQKICNLLIYTKVGGFYRAVRSPTHIKGLSVQVSWCSSSNSQHSQCYYGANQVFICLKHKLKFNNRGHTLPNLSDTNTVDKSKAVQDNNPAVNYLAWGS